MAMIISGIGALMGGGGAAAGTAAQAEGYEMQADATDMQATDEETKGVQRAGEIKRALSKALGENAVKFAAAGQLVGEGAAEDNANALEERATDDISVDRADADARAAMLRARSAGYRKVAKRTRSAGGIGFIGNALSSFG